MFGVFMYVPYADNWVGTYTKCDSCKLFYVPFVMYCEGFVVLHKNYIVHKDN